jgi:hypothetical protein
MKLPTATGPCPTSTVATTVLVEVSITETVLSALLATYARVPGGFIATPEGTSPTGMAAVTLLVTVSITETLLLPRLATYAYVPGLPPLQTNRVQEAVSSPPQCWCRCRTLKQFRCT